MVAQRTGGVGVRVVARCRVKRRATDEGDGPPGADRPAPDAGSNGASLPARSAPPQAEAEVPEEALEGEIVDAPLPDEVFEGVPLPADDDRDDGPDAAVLPYVPLAGGTGTLLRRDALSRYLADINRFERLSPAEEQRLAIHYREHRDHEAAARLVTANLRLVVAVAFGFRRAVANVLDLVQEGNIGLMEAVERFDPAKGTRLSTYASWWIRSRMVKYLLDNWRLVRVGTTNARRKLLYNLQRERARLEALGIQPTTKLLAERLGTSQEDVIAVGQAIGARDVSLDAPIGEESTATRGDLMPDESRASPEEQVAADDFRRRLAAAFAQFRVGLNPRDLALLDERMLAEDPLTLQDIADREGVTREAVRQSEARLSVRLRAFLEERLPEAAEIRFERP